MSFRGPEFVKFYLIVVGISTGLAYYLRLWLQHPTKISLEEWPKLDIYETAYLVEGSYRAINTAIVSLVQRGHLTLLPEIKTLALANDLPEDSHPLEQFIMQTVDNDGRIGQIRLSVLPEVEPISKSLHDLGLLLTDDHIRIFRYCPTFVVLAVLLLGITEFLFGISPQQSVVYLIMLCILVVWIVYLFQKEKKLYRSRLGDRMLNKLRSDHAILRKITPEDATSNPSKFSLAFALFGNSILTWSPLADLGDTFASKTYRDIGWFDVPSY